MNSGIESATREEQIATFAATRKEQIATFEAIERAIRIPAIPEDHSRRDYDVSVALSDATRIAAEHSDDWALGVSGAKAILSLTVTAPDGQRFVVDATVAPGCWSDRHPELAGVRRARDRLLERRDRPADPLRESRTLSGIVAWRKPAGPGPIGTDEGRGTDALPKDPNSEGGER